MQQVGVDSNHLRAQSRWPLYLGELKSSGRPGMSVSCQNRTLAQQQDKHSADRFFGAREHHRECRTSLFDSNCAALHFG
jgi:hypothetical protein